jgi:hypothetical protein
VLRLRPARAEGQDKPLTVTCYRLATTLTPDEAALEAALARCGLVILITSPHEPVTYRAHI